MKESVFDEYDLYEIVKKLNGGDIRPVGETNYDRKALERQLTIQRVADLLIEDIFKVTDVNGSEASIKTARDMAFRWLYRIETMLEDNVHHIPKKESDTL